MNIQTGKAVVPAIVRADMPLENLTLDGRLDQLLAAAKRQLRLVMCISILGALAGLAYSLTATPLYTASTQLMIDSTTGGGDQTTAATLADVEFDNGAIDSQVEVLKSDRIARLVMEKLQLQNDPELSTSKRGIISSVTGAVSNWIGITPKPSEVQSDGINLEDAATRHVVDALRERLDVTRVRMTYVLDVQFTSASKSQAAKISRAFAAAYLEEQLEARFDSAKRSSEWLQRRTEDIKSKVLEAELAVQSYKSQNNLIAAGKDGQLVVEQQVADLMAQLTMARGDTAKAQARFQRMQSIMDTGDSEAAVTEALGNAIIVDLRNKLLSARKTRAELEKTLGAKHQKIGLLKSEIKQYENQIFDELRRISESYKSEFEIASKRESALESEIDQMVKENVGSGQTMVNLRELERTAESYRTLYQTLSQRYQASVQSQTFPVNEARILTSDSTPGKPSYPVKSGIIMLASLIGLALGLVLGVLREFFDRAIRTGAQVNDELGLEFLGYLPSIKVRQIKDVPNLTGQIVEHAGKASKCPPILRYSLVAPLSQYCETLRSAKVAVDYSANTKGAKVIGIVSCLPGEGKTTVAKNLASLVASQGSRTLLVDADLRNPSLSRSLATGVGLGLSEVLADRSVADAAVLHETDSGLHMILCVAGRKAVHTSQTLSSRAMEEFIDLSRSHYDYVFVDLPPIAPVVDVRAASRLFDSFVMVAKWGETSRYLLKSLLNNNAEIRDKACGVILGQVDMRKLGRYESMYGSPYYGNGYGSYFSEA
jgi:polysaccharide biosynthesis transport protein